MARASVGMLIALLILATGAAQSALALPVMTGRVLASDDGTPALGQPWRFSCWVFSPPIVEGGAIGVGRADGFFGEDGSALNRDIVVWTEASVPDLGAPFGLRGEAALTRAQMGAGLTNFPVSQLARLPDPSALPIGVDVRISWSAMQACGGDVLEPQGLAAYAVYRSAAGADAWDPVGRAGAAMTSFLDPSVPAGDWEWALKLVDVSGFVGSGFSLKTSAVTLAGDLDGDTVRDDVDDCVDIPDPAQLDSDGDGIADAAEPGVSDALLDVRRGSQPDALSFSWTAVAGAVSHDLAAHDIPIPGSPGFVAAWRDPARALLACRLPTGSSVDLIDAGAARYYLLSTRFARHEEWGADSFGVEHAATSPSCP